MRSLNPGIHPPRFGYASGITRPACHTGTPVLWQDDHRTARSPKTTLFRSALGRVVGIEHHDWEQIVPYLNVGEGLPGLTPGLDYNGTCHIRYGCSVRHYRPGHSSDPGET